MTASRDGAPPAAPPLARATLDRAAHRRTDSSWLAAAQRSARLLIVDTRAGGRALVIGGSDRPELVLFEPDSTPAADPGRAGPRLFLGVEPDGVAVFAVDAPLPDLPLADLPGARAVSLRDVGHLLSDRDAGLFTTAVALANWHARHPYSPVSGLPTTVADAGWSRVDADGARAWPRTDPAMIVLVNDGVPGPAGRCLLGSNAAWPTTRAGHRRFSCLAGYVEPGESVEAAVIREVAEEVGIIPTQVEYAGSQSWPYPGSLMLGFLARADPERPLRLDPSEMADARWFTREEVTASVVARTGTGGSGVAGGQVGRPVWLPPPSSIAFFLIDRWLHGGNELGP